jgi:prepilin-type N-terminal cleavage/methylation domain-containing protein
VYQKWVRYNKSIKSKRASMTQSAYQYTKRSAFTIVELLIVIVVIGILAAITIVAYNGIQERARASAATSALTQAVKKIKLYQVDAPDSTPDCARFFELVTGSTTNSSCSFPSGDIAYQYTANTNSYCITATKGATSYKISGTSQAEKGGCSGHGQGGVAAITNYALNPDADGSSATAFGFAGTPAASTRSIASDRSHNGSTSYKTLITGSGQTGAQMKVPLSTLRINNGEKISWSFWVYSTKAGNIIPYIDASKVVDGTYVGGAATTVSVPANTWTKVAATYTPAVDMYISQIGGYNLSVVANDTLWFDEFMITKTDTVQAYADGNTEGWVWNGTANNATSTGMAL